MLPATSSCIGGGCTAFGLSPIELSRAIAKRLTRAIAEDDSLTDEHLVQSSVG